MRALNWLLPLATVVAYGVLVVVLAPRLMAETGGAIPFDLRIFGYSLADAQAYLGAMSDAGKALYLGPIRANDTVFPVLFTLTLCLPLRMWHWATSLPALIYGLADLGENWAVARLIRAGADVDGPSVALASALTQAKYAAVAVAIMIALAGLWRGWRRGR